MYHIPYSTVIREIGHFDSEGNYIEYDARGTFIAEVSGPHFIKLWTSGTTPTGAGADLFITNNDRPSRKNIRGIQFIQPLDKVML